MEQLKSEEQAGGFERKLDERAGGLGGVGGMTRKQPEDCGCGCGEKHGGGNGAALCFVFALGMFLVFMAFKLGGQRQETGNLQSIKVEVAELRLKVSEDAQRSVMQTKETVTALRETVSLLGETRQMLVAMAGKMQGMEGAHNSLVKDLQSVISQNNRCITVLDRMLQDKFGKDKWVEMARTAEINLSQEAADQINAQIKAKEEAEKKAKDLKTGKK